MDNTSPNQGIGKKCNKCSKSRMEGAVFGTRTITNGIIGLYEKPTCKACEALYAKEQRQNNPDKIAEFKQKYREKHHGNIKHHVQDRISTWRKASGMLSNLTVEYLVSLYEQQDGYCFYSGRKMIFGWVDGKVHHDSLSLDKIDPAKGYVQGNVVWCTYLVNTMKQNMTDKQFYDVINSVYDTTYGISMIKELSIADKLRKLTTQAKLGELPKVIEQACAKEAELGKNSCRLRFMEKNGAWPSFYGSLGTANKEIYQDLHKPFERKFPTATDHDLVRQVIKDLQEETGLRIVLLDPPRWRGNNEEQDQKIVKQYWVNQDFQFSIIVDISWDPTGDLTK